MKQIQLVLLLVFLSAAALHAQDGNKPDHEPGSIPTAQAKDSEEDRKALALRALEPVRGLLLQALDTEDPGEIRRILETLKHLGKKAELRQTQDEKVRGFFRTFGLVEDLFKFYMALSKKDTAEMITRINNMEYHQDSALYFLSLREWEKAVANLNQKAGFLTPKAYEDLLNSTLTELLNDKNQNRLEDILESISREQQKLSQLGRSHPNLSSRWRRAEGLARSLLHAVWTAREGGLPQLSIESWTTYEGIDQPLIKKSDLIASLTQYRVRKTGEDGKTIELRLFYDSTELRSLADQWLAELTQDANQERLNEILAQIRDMQQWSSSQSSTPDLRAASEKLQQLEQFARYFTTLVGQVQNGGISHVNLDSSLNFPSNSAFSLKREELLMLCRNYRVKVRLQDDKIHAVPLYQDLNDVLARIRTLDDLVVELPLLSGFSRAFSDSGMRLGSAIPRLSALAEVHKSMQTGKSFTLSSNMAAYESEYSGHARVESRVLMDKIGSLKADLELAVITRFFPTHKPLADESPNAMMDRLLRVMLESKQYEEVLKLSRISQHLQPTTPLLAPQETIALQNYLEGVRQMEVFGQARLATLLFQRAVAARSELIPESELRERLHKLKAEQPQDYERGTEDFLKSGPVDFSGALTGRPSGALVIPAAK